MSSPRKEFTTPKGTHLPLLNNRGKEYLEVKYRLVWFREERPDWRIRTEFRELGDTFAVVRAEIFNERGEMMANAHKREDKGHFSDFMEKAETGAIGRALSFVGYGTQFAADELDEGERIVDAPVEPSRIDSNDLVYRYKYPDPLSGRRLSTMGVDELFLAESTLLRWKSAQEKGTSKTPYPDDGDEVLAAIQKRLPPKNGGKR